MKKSASFLMVFALLGLSLAADVIPPGSRPIPVTSRISNISDFEDYVFFSAQTGLEDRGMSLSMCPVYLVGEEGTVNPRYYKLCPLSLYAVRKDLIDLSKFDAEGKLRAEDLGWSLAEAAEYLRSLEPEEVVRGIKISLTVPAASPKKVEIHDYAVELGTLKEAPDDIKNEKNILASLYYVLPVPALLLLGFFTFRRLRRKS
jgi:hypothetical protein